MAVTGRRSLDNLSIIEVDSDPRISININCTRGSLAIWDDGGTSDGRLFKKFGSGNLNWVELPTIKEINIAATDYNTNNLNYRTRSVASTGSQRFTFIIPTDFTTLISMQLLASVSVGAAGPGRQISLISNYGKSNEEINLNIEINTLTLDLTGMSNLHKEIDISSVFTGIEAGDRCGLLVDHLAILGSIDYLSLKLRYR
jgi:hypothetical protein